MAQTIKLKRSSVSGNTPGTSDLELGEVAINTYDGKMFIKKNDGSDSIVEIGGGGSGTVTEAFKTIAVSGQSSVIADAATDTLTLVAGSNMTITTNQAGDSITFASSGGGGTQNVFSTFAVSGQTSVVADSSTDTLTLAAGSGINITTNNTTDTITIAATASAITVQDEGSSLSTAATTLNFVGAGVTASGTGATKTITIGGGGGSQNVFSNIGVSGQGTIQADTTTDTLTFVAGTGISLATDTTADSLTITATGGGGGSVANAASSIKEFKYDISSSTTTLTGSDANSNTLAYEAGAIQVFLNGILLDPATDYTATNGTSVVLTDAAVNGDDVQIVSFNRKIVTANVGIDTFTGDASGTRTFTLSSDPVNKNNTRVMIDGVYQAKSSYSVSGTTLTFGSGASDAPPNGSAIEVEVGFTQAEIGSTLDFADNAKLRLGDSNDLQIYHDGTNSRIADGANPIMTSSSIFQVLNANTSETMLKAIEDGAVELYFDNSKKLETVTGGVTITGTITATTFSGDLSGTINTATTGATQSASDNSTKLATTAYVTTALSNLVDSAPGTLNTLNELAAALGDDANFSTTITNSLNLKVGRDSATGAASMPAGTTAQRPGSPAAGQFRYNSTLSQFEGYTSSWGAIGGGGTNTFTTDTLTTSGSATVTLSQAVSSPNDCIVHIDGIYQTPTDAYTVSGTTLTFTATPASGRKVVVYSVKAGVSGNNLNVQSINGDGINHTFTLNVNPINENNTIIHIDGVYQQKSSYTVNGTQLSFGSGNIPANNTVIEVATFTQTEINVPVNDTIDTVHIKDDAVTSAKLGGNLTMPGNISFANNGKAIFGASSNLEIYYDGNHSYIKEGASGNLKIGGTNLHLMNGALTEYYFAANENGAAYLYYDNAQKLETASGGVTVTGTLTATTLAGTLSTAAQTNITSLGTLTGLNVTGANTNNFATSSGGTPTTIQITGTDAYNSGYAGAGIRFGGKYHSNGNTATLAAISGIKENTTDTQYGGALTFFTRADGSGAGSTERMRIDSSGKVGIGTTSPATPLTINGTDPLITFENGESPHWQLGFENTQSDRFVLYDNNASAYRLVVDSSGKVGIGLSTSLSSTLNVNTEISVGPDANNRGIINYSSDTLSFGTRQSSSNYFSTVNITGGKVGIGTSNQTEKFEVSGSINSTYQSTNFSGGAQRGFLDMVHSSKHVRVGSVTGTATASGTQGTVEIIVNNSPKVVVTPGGDIGIGNTSPLDTLNEGITIGPRTILSDVVDYQTLLGNNAYYKTGNVWKSVVATGGGYSAVRMYNGLFRVHTGTVSAADQTLSNMDGSDIRLTINSTGNVGIGETSPDGKLHVRGGSSAGGQVWIQTDGTFAGTDEAQLNFRHYDDTGAAGAQIKLIGTTSYSGDMVFSVRGGGTSGAGGAALAERMRITHGGTVEITKNGSNGTTNDQYGLITISAGSGTQATLGAHHTADSYANLNLSSVVSGQRRMWHISKRKAVDNNQLEYYYYDASGFQSKFTFATDGKFTPTGGIQLGGSGTANHLDDYEEGIWTPDLRGHSTAGSFSPSNANGGFYIKVGRMVQVWMNVSGALSGASGVMRVYGLPFPCTANASTNGTNAVYSTGSLQYWSGAASDVMGPLCYPSSSYLYFHTYNGTSTGASPQVTNQTHNLHCCACYITN